MRLGIVANELFDPAVGRIGGFGWAVRQAATCFASEPGLGVEPVMLMGQRVKKPFVQPERVHGCEVVWIGDSLIDWARAVRAARIDMFLSIDFRPNYRAFFALCPRTPILVWVRDPWDNRDREIIARLRVPGHHGLPQGVASHPTRSLAHMAAISKVFGRRLHLVVTTPALAAKVPDSYGLSAESVGVMPNIVEPCIGAPAKAERPVIAFLARLDPYKRPWLLIELARRIPEAEFVVMGKRHFSGSGAWEPGELPPNMRMLGHAGEPEKRAELARAWLLLNTSIHEGLAVSYLEALAHEAPLVSCVDTEGLATRFGRAVARHPGDGLDALPSFEIALREMIADHEERVRLGRAGRLWVEATHSREAFLRAFFAHAGQLGVRRG
ncbi:MAG: glycosyltransferase family 4 protein [Acidobacteria bacterium]|nr:glycosyltransferase family 4 protein [Acidobacteriota bacterium]